MKKIILALMLVTVLAGCAGRTNNNTSNTTTPSDNSTNTNDNTTKSTDQNSGTAQNQTTDWYGNFETGLKGKNVNYTSKSSLDASTIGGVEGYRYVTENGNIDIYRFEDGEDLNKIKTEKKITTNGTTSNVEVVDHYVIVSDNLSDDVLNIFRNMK